MLLIRINFVSLPHKPINLKLQEGKKMAKRKDLKQFVNEVSSALFAECLAAKLYFKGVNPHVADEILTDILTMQDDFLSRISHTEPGNVKGFYKKFNQEFDQRVTEIVDAIDKLTLTEK